MGLMVGVSVGIFVSVGVIVGSGVALDIGVCVTSVGVFDGTTGGALQPEKSKRMIASRKIMSILFMGEIIS